MKIRIKFNKKQKKQQEKKINEIKSQFFEITLAIQIMKQKKISIRNEKDNITTFSTESKKIIRNPMNNFMSTNLTTQMKWTELMKHTNSLKKKKDNLNSFMFT